MTKRTTVGILGIHGFSRVHLTQFLACQNAGECQVIGAVAHERERDEVYATGLETQGVRLVPDLEALLALTPDLVSIPLGIHLHTPVTLRCLEAGCHVYLEKPVAGSIAEVDQLIAAERASGLTVLVGFQDLFQPGLWDLKRRLVSGEFGAIKQITVTVGWPRPRSYYSRNAWAGRLQLGGAWVRDSIANNACAHFLNVGLFLAGKNLDQSAEFRSVSAELGRGYPIESFDTASIDLRTASDVRVLFNASHLGQREFGPSLRIDTAKGAISIENLEQGSTWQLPDGSVIPVLPRHQVPYQHALRFLAGEDVPVCRLLHGRAHTLAIELAHQGSVIVDLLELTSDVEKICHPRMDEALSVAHQRGIPLSETGLISGFSTT